MAFPIMFLAVNAARTVAALEARIAALEVATAASHATITRILAIPVGTAGRQASLTAAIETWDASIVEAISVRRAWAGLSSAISIERAAAISHASKSGISLLQAVFSVDGGMAGLSMEEGLALAGIVTEDATVVLINGQVTALVASERAFIAAALSGSMGVLTGVPRTKVKNIENDFLAPLPFQRWNACNGSRSTGELDPQLITTRPCLLRRIACEASGEEGANKTTVGSLKCRNASGGVVVLTVPPGLGTFGNIYEDPVGMNFPSGLLIEQTSTADRFLIQWTLNPPQTPNVRFPNWRGMS